MINDWKAGLADQDDMDQYPNASRPLDQLGIDPDEARANPDLLAKATGKGNNGWHPPMASPAGQSPSPSAAAAGAVGGAGAPVSPSDSGDATKEASGLLMENLRGATTEAEQMTTTPPADVERLQAQRQKLAVPAPRFDPTTGKALATTQEFNPDTGQMETVNPRASIGQKIWRGVRGGLVGGLTGGIPDAVVGALEPQDIRGGQAYNAPSKAYQQAETRRAQQLGSTDEQLKTALQTWKDVNEARKGKAGELRAISGIGKDILTGENQQAMNDIRQQLADVAKVKESDQKSLMLERLSNDLENKTRALDLRQMSIEQQGRIQDLSAQLREQKLQSDASRFVTGTDAKSLEAERKARLASIEDDWKAHPYINKLFGDKNKEIKIVNDDVNARLAATGVVTGIPDRIPPPPATPPKGYSRVRASDGSVHDIPTRFLNRARQRDPQLQIMGGSQ